ncbi:MAG TPA: Ku protein, partial [Pirellulales bacterium]
QAYTSAAAEHGEMHFHQLHKGCNSRIRYQKVCPVHGEVSRDEIDSGYEYAKGQYVVVEDSEREQAHTKSDRAINIDKFIPPEAVDPMFFEGRTYYLVPDGAAGQKPYALFYRAMVDEHRAALGQLALAGRDRLVLVRAGEKLLTMSVLNYADQVRQPADFEEMIADIPIKGDELRLARTLIESTSSDEIDLSGYKDTYTEKLREIVEAKVSGQEVVAASDEQEPPVVNLMDALRRSVARNRPASREKAAKGRAREAAPARGRRKPAARRTG